MLSGIAFILATIQVPSNLCRCSNTCSAQRPAFQISHPNRHASSTNSRCNKCVLHPRTRSPFVSSLCCSWFTSPQRRPLNTPDVCSRATCTAEARVEDFHCSEIMQSFPRDVIDNMKMIKRRRLTLFPGRRQHFYSCFSSWLAPFFNTMGSNEGSENIGGKLEYKSSGSIYVEGINVPHIYDSRGMFTRRKRQWELLSSDLFSCD